MDKVKYLIIGAGISGLTFACKKQTEDYLIIERDTVYGGLCQSFYEDGFVWDVAGHFFHFHSEKTKKFYEKLMAGKKMRTVEKCAKVFYAAKYMDAPFQYNIHQLPTEEFLECLTDLYYAEDLKYNMQFDEFVRKKYGNGIAKKFLIPYNEKLYACQMNELEKDSMGSFLPRLDFEMLMNFYRGSRGITYNDTFSYPVNGCVEMINSLVEMLDKSRIHLSEAVVSIDIKEKIVKTSKNVYQYEYLINTAPLNSFAKMVGIEDYNALSANQVLVLNLGFDQGSIDKKMSWVYYPGEEIFYRIGFYNNIAGTERLSIYVEISYKEGETINIDEALKRTLCDLKRVNVITDHRLIAYKPYVINPGYVHITEKGSAFTEHFIEKMKCYDVHMIGRYARWQYSAMDDSMEQAFTLSEVI